MFLFSFVQQFRVVELSIPQQEPLCTTVVESINSTGALVLATVPQTEPSQNVFAKRIQYGPTKGCGDRFSSMGCLHLRFLAS
eukprot:5043189-Amphidinium_carterae.1